MLEKIKLCTNFKEDGRGEVASKKRVVKWVALTCTLIDFLQIFEFSSFFRTKQTLDRQTIYILQKSKLPIKRFPLSLLSDAIVT